MRPLGGLDCRVLQAAEAGASDLAIGLLADGQRGVVTRAQLLACGLSADAISRRRVRGWLRVLHRGVYAVGHTALPELGRETAALLAVGEGAVLSHHSAAALWGIRPPRPAAAIDITAVARNPGPKSGVRVHRVKELDPREVTWHQRLPTVTAAMALLDLAPELTLRALEQAVDEALIHELTTEEEIAAVMERHPRRGGAPSLRELIGAGRASALTRSEAEERFLRLVRRARLPQPEVNVRLGPYRIDYLWREQRVAVEIDGFKVHGMRSRFESDRRRDVELRAAGFTVLRFTWLQLRYEPEVILVRLGQVMPLSLRARAGS